jgi:GNAT superfamily N-acetyltransferase
MEIDSMLVWVLADNLACRFYEILGGQRVYEKEIERGGTKLIEIAYGWTDLSNLSSDRVMSTIEIVAGYVPGAIGRIAEMHGTYYHKHWGFGLFFEAKVATGLSTFLQRYDANRDGFWTVSVAGRVEGSIAIDGIDAGGKGAHLRYFILSDELRGKGVGNQLIETAVEFCRSRRYKRVYLWTFEGLGAARHLYEKMGFVLVEQFQGTQWGKAVNEQRFELQIESF